MYKLSKIVHKEFKPDDDTIIKSMVKDMVIELYDRGTLMDKYGMRFSFRISDYSETNLLFETFMECVPIQTRVENVKFDVNYTDKKFSLMQRLRILFTGRPKW